MRAAAATFLTLAILWGLAAQVNHSLSPWHVSVFVDGLAITYAALALPLGPGLAAVLGAGLLADANSPVAFGARTLMLGFAYAILFRMRHRLPHEETAGQVGIALLANFALFFGLTFLVLRPVPAGGWPRLGADLVCSQAFLGLIAPWFFALQERALALAEAVPAPALRP